MEHRREGGALAKYRGEERILLFRSDRAGAIAKIIYSSELPEAVEVPTIDNTSLSTSLYSTAHAKIHVLDVKSQYRGRDLGGLLFNQAIASLKERYCNDDVDYNDDIGIETQHTNLNGPFKSNQECNQHQHRQMYDLECSLDAEEDILRHGKLVSFYENLGCRVTSKRVRYMNNNDHETYRKVPMQINLHPPTKEESPRKQERSRVRRRRFTHLNDDKKCFLPVQLIGTHGRVSVNSNSDVMKLHWLISESDRGIQFVSTLGHLLLASPNGTVSVFCPGDQDDEISDLDDDINELMKRTHFVPVLISDSEDDDTDSLINTSGKCLWVLKTCHGTFLSADLSRETLTCTKVPSFWQANGRDLSLMCTSDNPSRRQHYRKCWKYQTYDYVSSMRSRFLTFSLGKATLIEALRLIHAFSAYPFHTIDESQDSPQSASPPSLRTLCFLMAETARSEGHPDWLQLLALFHELGAAVKVLDTHTGNQAESYDWSISSRVRVVGCKVPSRATFREFQCLNTDGDDSRYNTDTGIYQEHCGLDNVLLQWTGNEYMYYLLKHNNTSLPNEALACLRYNLLGDFHEHNEYSVLMNKDDEDMLPFIQTFDALRRSVRLKCVDCADLSDEECSSLWDGYYSNLAAKYQCDHIFSW